MNQNKVVSFSAQENGRNHSGKKELTSAYSVIVLKDGEMRELIVARCWMGRSSSSSVVYASIWIHGGGVYAAGNDSAGGGGYHKESAAIEGAMQSAGFKFEKEIGGVGETAIRDGLEAIAHYLGYESVLVVNHG